MRKIKVQKNIVMSIIILIIVFFVSIYTLSRTDYVISENLFIGVMVGLLILTIIGIITIVKIFKSNNIKPEKALLCIIIPFCIIITVAMPVGRGHDEYMHWIKAFEVSEGRFISKIDNEKKQSVATVPENVQNIVKERQHGIYKYVDNIPLLQEKINYDNYIQIPNQNAAAYCFVQYIPEVLGILIGKVITQNPLLSAYISRIANIVTCTMLMYFAIKLIPFGKNILLILSIIPIVIEGFSTISPDGITIAICALFISYTMYIAFDKNKKCGAKEMLILTTLGAIVSLCKIVYMPLIFLAIIIPKEKFKSKKNKIFYLTIIIGIGVICNLIWLGFGSMALLSTNTNTYAGTEQNGTVIKVMSILSNPIMYLQKLFYTIGVKGNQYFLSLFGGQLEWAETIRMDFIPYIICGISIITAISEHDLKDKLNKYQKIIILFIILVITILIFTSLFIQWSENNLNYIDGVQGRYFLPILPLVLILINGIKVNSKYTTLDITKLICISSIIVQLYTLTALLAEHL